MKLDIIIPIYNNEKNIKDFYTELNDLFKDIKHTIIFINNSSTDNSENLLKELYKNDDENIKIITLSKFFDKNSVILAGLKHSKNDFICISDINESPKYILKSYKFIKDNESYDCVCYCNKNNKNNIFRKLFINYVIKNTNIKNIDIFSNIKIMRKNVLSAIIELSNSKGYSNAIYDNIGFNIYYDYSYNVQTIKDNLFNYICNYSLKPLKFVSIFGLFLILISFAYLIYSIITSLSIVSAILILLLFFSGINICLISFVGNLIFYMIKRESCNSNYIIKEKIGFEEKYL